MYFFKYFTISQGHIGKTDLNTMIFHYTEITLTHIHLPGLYEDAATAMDFLLRRKDVDARKIVLFGRSLGGAVAIQLASSASYANKVCCLIVENTFTSLIDIGKHIFDIKVIHYLPEWCHKNKVCILSINTIKIWDDIKDHFAVF